MPLFAASAKSDLPEFPLWELRYCLFAWYNDHEEILTDDPQTEW